jgi:hypothetical protein
MSKEAIAAAWRDYLDHAANHTQQFIEVRRLPREERAAKVVDLENTARPAAVDQIRKVISLVIRLIETDSAVENKRLLADLETLLYMVKGQVTDSLPFPQKLELISMRIDNLPEGGLN